MTKPKIIDPSEYPAIYTAYMEGKTQKQIAVKYGVSRNTIGRVLDQLGLKNRTYRRGCRKDVELEKAVVKLYRFGLSRSEIASKLDISFDLVSKILNDKEIEITNRREGSNHHRAKKAKAAAEERKALYEQGYTCAEINRMLGDGKNRCQRLLTKYFPAVLIPESEQHKRQKRLLMQAANKELMRADHILSNRFK